MRIYDNVVLRDDFKNVSRPGFWQELGIDPNMVGIITYISDGDLSTMIEVRWPNGKCTICANITLKLYEKEDISLPNLKFIRNGEVV